jgi:hypothetical protein
MASNIIFHLITMDRLSMWGRDPTCKHIIISLYHLYKYREDILEKLSEMYEIVVFTAGVRDYADHILDEIDPSNTIFKKRLYRNDCI